MKFLLTLQDHHISLELRVKDKLAQDVWWLAMEKSYLAFQDLQFMELLDVGIPARKRV